MAKFNFEDLCGQPLSAADYIEITRNFGTLFVVNIPKMGVDRKDLVRVSLYSVKILIILNAVHRHGDLLPLLMVRVYLHFPSVNLISQHVYLT